MPSEEEIYGAIARGWCDERNSGKEMDVDLADAIAIEVLAVVRPRIATLESQLKQAQEALEEIIYVPGENGPIPKSCADEMCQIAEAALQALGEGGDHAD